MIITNQHSVKHWTRDAQNLYVVVRANPAGARRVFFFKKKVAKQKISRQGRERRNPAVNRPLYDREIGVRKILVKMRTYF
jgi:hypothetical protein